MKDPTPARIVTLRRLGLAEESATPNNFEAVSAELEADPHRESLETATSQYTAAVRLQNSAPDAQRAFYSDEEIADPESSPVILARSASPSRRDAMDVTAASPSPATRSQSESSQFNAARSVEARDKKPNPFVIFRSSYSRHPLQADTGLTLALRLTKLLLVVNGGAAISALVFLGVANLGALSTTSLSPALLPSIDAFVVGLSSAVLIAVLSYGAQIIGFEFPSWPYVEKSLRATACAALILAIISFGEFASGALSMVKGLNVASVHDAVVSVSVPIPPVSATEGVSAR